MLGFWLQPIKLGNLWTFPHVAMCLRSKYFFFFKLDFGILVLEAFNLYFKDIWEILSCFYMDDSWCPYYMELSLSFLISVLTFDICFTLYWPVQVQAYIVLAPISETEGTSCMVFLWYFSMNWHMWHIQFWPSLVIRRVIDRNFAGLYNMSVVSNNE